LVNPKLIKCVSENMFQKYPKKNNPKDIFKMGKIVFLKNDGCRKKFVGYRKKQPSLSHPRAKPLILNPIYSFIKSTPFK